MPLVTAPAWLCVVTPGIISSFLLQVCARLAEAASAVEHLFSDDEHIAGG
jgi:hypothetical protein